MNTATTHNILQLHGGGALVISGIIKCAILEITSGKRIKDLFDTTICDSGGAIARLCMEKVTAQSLLKIFAEIIGNTLPGRRFYFTQPLSREKRRFNNSELHDRLKTILQDTNLEEFQGNLFVGAHHHHEEDEGDGAVTFGKFTGRDGKTTYTNIDRLTPLYSIAGMTSTIPGVYQEYQSSDPAHADGTYLDSIVNQHPARILYKVKVDNPERDIHYVQMGNIEEKGIARSLLQRSVMVSRFFNFHWKYVVHQLHSSHLSDAAEMVGKDKTESFITYSAGRVSPADPSIEQLTRVIIDTLKDVERRNADYTTLSLRLNNNEPLQMGVAQAVEELKAVLDPMMKKRKVILGKNETPPVEFPSPIVLWAESSPYYKPAYNLGSLTQSFAPTLCRYLIDSDFRLGDAFLLACKSGLRKLTPSPRNSIEPK